MSNPKIRTARVLNSFQTVMRIARQQNISMCIAYVDNKGKTMMLWRERDADIGWLSRAEAAAFTAIAENVDDLPLKTLLQSRIQSNEIFRFSETPLPNVRVDGGKLLIVNGYIVGAVAVVGDLDLSDIAVAAYLETPVAPMEPTTLSSDGGEANLDHFGETAPAGLFNT
jgi:uncharacterized protein GlcG (DUF336 family)